MFLLIEIDTLTQIHDSSLSWLGTGTSIKIIKSGGVKLVLWAQNPLEVFTLTYVQVHGRPL